MGVVTKRTVILIIVACCCIPCAAFAGGIFVNSQQSAEYVRLFNRNAATDNADIVYYNMAGTTKMKDGWYINTSNMSFIQKATVETHNNRIVGDREYKSDNPFLMFPNAYFLYKKDDWSLFGAYQTIGATAVRKWDDGLPSLDLIGRLLPQIRGDIQSELEGKSAYYCLRLGGAKALNDVFSVALSGRFVYTTQKVEGKVWGSRSSTKLIIDAEDKGYGGSFSVGINIAPTDRLNIGMTYEHFTRIELETDVGSADNEEELLGWLDQVIFKDGNQANLDLPQELRMGISYYINPRLRIEGSLNFYLEDQVDFSYLGENYKTDYEDTYEAGACLEYTWSPRLKVSAGFLYTWIGQDEDSTTDSSIPGAHTDYISIAGGFQYEVVHRLLTKIPGLNTCLVNVGVCYTGFVHKYNNDDAMGGLADLLSPGATQEYNKQYIVIALGCEFRF